jgi:pyridoxamine 5'-phosphate oxidase
LHTDKRQLLKYSGNINLQFNFRKEMLAIADLRQEYSKASLDVTSVQRDPVKQFEKWFTEAVQAQVPEPNAMNLATISATGAPTSRIVLLKGIENNKFVFYTNYQSSKGKELEKTPACALTFFWPELERQVRIEGTATRVDTILEERVKQIEKKFEGHEIVPKPHQWGGFEVDPLLIEFWQGRPSRLHDRIQFNKVDGVWKIYRLAP